MEVSSKEYATLVEDRIEDALGITLYVTFNGLAGRFGFPRIVAGKSEERFEEVYESGYAAELRDVAIRFFEELGMDVKPDGRDF